ncbi:hypothetical protein G6F63_014233 [Rhizopus arrhizus]|nr:hypothetical protein G6F63_014233 [Rhizopus arrhizus]
MRHVHPGLDLRAAVRLQDAGRHAFGHVGSGISDVDLAAGNAVGPAIQRNRFGQPCHRVLGCRIGDGERARRVR